MSHSPTPWSQSGVQIYDAKGQIVIGASYGTDRENDTPFIVRAVNCHDELVAALKAAKAEIEHHCYLQNRSIVSEIDLALANAEAK